MCLGVSVGLRVLDSREGPWLLEGQPLTAPSSGVPREQRNRPETWVELGWAVGGSAGVSLTPALWNSPRQPGGKGGEVARVCSQEAPPPPFRLDRVLHMSPSVYTNILVRVDLIAGSSAK